MSIYDTEYIEKVLNKAAVLGLDTYEFDGTAIIKRNETNGYASYTWYIPDSVTELSSLDFECDLGIDNNYTEKVILIGGHNLERFERALIYGLKADVIDFTQFKPFHLKSAGCFMHEVTANKIVGFENIVEAFNRAVSVDDLMIESVVTDSELTFDIKRGGFGIPLCKLAKSNVHIHDIDITRQTLGNAGYDDPDDDEDDREDLLAVLNLSEVNTLKVNITNADSLVSIVNRYENILKHIKGLIMKSTVGTLDISGIKIFSSNMIKETQFNIMNDIVKSVIGLKELSKTSAFDAAGFSRTDIDKLIVNRDDYEMMQEYIEYIKGNFGIGTVAEGILLGVTVQTLEAAEV